jgi:hypothetical protein
MDVSLSPIRYAKEEDKLRFFHTLKQRLNSLPGVDSAGGV